MRILIAPDKFKGSLDAREVAENIAKGLHDELPDAKIDIVPMADGGEGTAEAIAQARACSWLECKAHDPLGREIDARYAWNGDGKLAIMEMSEAAGMRRISEDERDPVRATTFGAGEMISDAANRGANKIIIGLGGSATNDGGFGMARALGFRFFSDEKELTEAVPELADLTRIETPVAAGVSPANSTTQPARLPPQLKIIAAVDVKNPLLGKNGATRVFGPQKGASKKGTDILERALTRLADVVAKEFGFDYRDEAGAGAAGLPPSSTRDQGTAGHHGARHRLPGPSSATGTPHPKGAGRLPSGSLPSWPAGTCRASAGCAVRCTWASHGRGRCARTCLHSPPRQEPAAMTRRNDHEGSYRGTGRIGAGGGGMRRGERAAGALR